MVAIRMRVKRNDSISMRLFTLIISNAAVDSPMTVSTLWWSKFHGRIQTDEKWGSVRMRARPRILVPSSGTFCVMKTKDNCPSPRRIYFICSHFFCFIIRPLCVYPLQNVCVLSISNCFFESISCSVLLLVFGQETHSRLSSYVIDLLLLLLVLKLIATFECECGFVANEKSYSK